MKNNLHWLLFSLISIVLISSTAKANKLASYSPKNIDNFPRKILSIAENFPGNVPENTPINPTNNQLFAGVVPLGKKMSDVEIQVRKLMIHYSFLKPGMFFLDLQTGDYIDINGDQVFPAASTIKFPVLIALFEEIDAGRVNLNETLVMRRNLVASGSGVMQYRRPGTKFSLRETVNKMISISDNTAANMIIDRLGGKAKLNERFHSWGLQSTVIRNLLGDFHGTNTTSAKDLVRLSALITNHQLISESSFAEVITIMRGCKNHRLLADGVGKGAKIAHKTGDIGFVVGDAGIIETPNGRTYLAGMFVRRPHDDERGREFVRRVSGIVYKYLN